MSRFVSLERAVAHVRASDSERDDVLEKLAAAEAMILGYVTTDAVDDWDSPDTTPAAVRGAVLIQLAQLFRFRGDDERGAGPDYGGGQLSPEVRLILAPYHDPVVA